MCYKFSKYNIVVSRNDVDILFNTRSLSMVTLEDHLADIFKKEDASKLGTIEDTILDDLLENGFILPMKADELNILKKEYWNLKLNSEVLDLYVLTTLNCNFRCSYCFEHRANAVLDRQVQNSIIRYLQENISKYKFLKVNWFGGEPLLNLEAIEYMSPKIIEICKNNNVQYAASITTNGHNLSSEVVDKLDKLQVRHICTTIDGPKDIHDQRRMLSGGGGSFDRIIQNIKNAKEKIDVSIRINLDTFNANRVKEFIDYLKDNDLLDIKINIRSVVSGDENPCTDVELKAQDFAKAALDIHKYLFSLGVKPSILSLLENMQRSYCYADIDSHLVIDPRGLLYKCGDGYDGSDLGRIGSLEEDGTVDIDENKNNLWMKDPFEHEECIDCNLMPICMGGCRMKRMVKKRDWCIPEYKENLEELIYLYYEYIAN